MGWRGCVDDPIFDRLYHIITRYDHLHFIPLEIVCHRRRPERLNGDSENISNIDYDVNAPFSVGHVSAHSQMQTIQRHCTGICSSKWTAHGHHTRVHSLDRALRHIVRTLHHIITRHEHITNNYNGNARLSSSQERVNATLRTFTIRLHCNVDQTRRHFVDRKT